VHYDPRSAKSVPNAIGHSPPYSVGCHWRFASGARPETRPRIGGWHWQLDCQWALQEFGRRSSRPRRRRTPRVGTSIAECPALAGKLPVPPVFGRRCVSSSTFGEEERVGSPTGRGRVEVAIDQVTRCLGSCRCMRDAADRRLGDLIDQQTLKLRRSLRDVSGFVVHAATRFGCHFFGPAESPLGQSYDIVHQHRNGCRHGLLDRLVIILDSSRCLKRRFVGIGDALCSKLFYSIKNECTRFFNRGLYRLRIRVKFRGNARCHLARV